MFMGFLAVLRDEKGVKFVSIQTTAQRRLATGWRTGAAVSLTVTARRVGSACQAASLKSPDEQLDLLGVVGKLLG